MQNFTVDEQSAGKRLDVFLGEKYPGYSRAFLQRLCSESHVLINGKPEKPGHKIRQDESVEIQYDFELGAKIADIDLSVLYEDDDVIVINKPAGIISHARGRYWYEPSVASFVRQKTGQEGERAGIVHRLDRATSGVMICAKNQQALSWLQKQFSHRRVKKTYVALVEGTLKAPSAVIDMPIERNPKKPQTFRVGSNGKSARTTYTVIVSGESLSELELKPETGRTHQLRVHLHQIGHPIIGDELYGGKKSERLMLHSYRLEITLPGGKRRVFTAPVPDEFKSMLP